MNIHFELTQEQYATLMSMLEEYSNRCFHDAAAFAHLGKTGYDQAVELLKRAQEAFRLSIHLSKFGEE